MFGTGLRRALDGDAAMVVERLRDWDGLTVAVDIPSGVDGLTGAVRGTAVHADRTVTFAALKPGLLFEPGRSHAGEVTVADIGIDLGPDGAEPSRSVASRPSTSRVPAAARCRARTSGERVYGGRRIARG